MRRVPASIKDHHPVCSHKVHPERTRSCGDQEEPHSVEGGGGGGGGGGSERVGEWVSEGMSE